MNGQERAAAECELLTLLEAEDYFQCEESLAHFCRAAWHILEPNKERLENWHLELICEYLEACYYGEILNLIINMPPRYAKSIIVTVCFPVWIWLKAPHKRFINASGKGKRNRVECKTDCSKIPGGT